jgi:hypothetical protein
VAVDNFKVLHGMRIPLESKAEARADAPVMTDR